ncbi:hypothetical protein GW17_00037013 [Ensete ventricosum]|nr:hypothetical protein GW17_00037013 [Ensete ventricosum]
MPRLISRQVSIELGRSLSGNQHYPGRDLSTHYTRKELSVENLTYIKPEEILCLTSRPSSGKKKEAIF